MSAENRRSSYLILLAAALLQIVWGLVPSASNLVVREVSVEIYIALRWTISSLIFFAVLAHARELRTMWKRTSPSVALLGALGYGVGSLGMLYGLKLGGVVNFALLSAFSPLMTTLASIVFLKERPSRRFWLAFPLSLLGLVLIVAGKQDLSGLRLALVSALFIAGASALEALVFVFSKRLHTAHSRIGYLATAQGAAALFMWMAQLTVYHQASELAKLSAQGWVAALFVSVVACVLCYYVLHWLVLSIPGHKLSLFEGLHAVSAVAFGVIFFGERLSPLMWVGGAAILLGLLIGHWRESEPPARD